MTDTIPHKNPLLDFSDFPRFQDILPEHVEPALDTILRQNRKRIKQLLACNTVPDWNNFMLPVEALNDRLERMWAPISHLHGVKDSDALRPVYQACLPKLSDYAAEIGQNKALFEKTRTIYEARRQLKLTPAQIKSLENDLLDFKLSGVDLPTEQQTRYREINGELSKYGNQFSQNVLDATDGWTLHVEKPEELAGLPDSVIALAKTQAQRVGKSGWLFTLQAPSYVPFMTYADNARLRQKMYRAYVTRASELGPDGGEWDNSAVMRSILKLRAEKARILGFQHYGEYSLQTKMASGVDEVEQFLTDLAAQSKPAAEQELRALKQFAAEEYQVSDLQAWDYAWYSEKLRQKKYDFSQEALRPYFPLPRVMEGMFRIVNHLFGIRVETAGAAQIWHKDVMFFKISDSEGGLRGYFYVDLFAREAKRGGAWMADAVGRRRTASGIQLPVAFLICNFSAPVDGRPSLLTHEEVITLFHEFGHGLHHLLTRVDVAGVAGINGVPWDAVELPSQFLENWCWEREALDLISGHIETGESIPDELLEKMRKAKNFQSAMQMVRQIEFSLFDLRIHRHTDISGENSIQDILDQVRDEVSVVETPAFNRFQHSFGHIFAGGYAAGYYSYKWAEVLSADAYSLFEEKGIFDKPTGQSFLTHILEKGGSEEPMTLFKAFRGRAPSIEPLLRHSGLSNAPITA